MRISSAENALKFASAAAFYECLTRQFQVVQCFRVLFARECTALEIEQFSDQVVDYVLDAAAVDSDFAGVTVLKDDVDVVSLDASVAPIQASEAFHVFTHAKSPVLQTRGPRVRVLLLA